MNMTVQSENERNKAVVDEYFKAGVQGHLTSFAAYLHPDFTVTAPNYLPWGGRHVGAAFFRDQLLPSVTDISSRRPCSRNSGSSTASVADPLNSFVWLTRVNMPNAAAERIPHGLRSASDLAKESVCRCR
jgi:hypothetical protein